MYKDSFEIARKSENIESSALLLSRLLSSSDKEEINIGNWFIHDCECETVMKYLENVEFVIPLSNGKSDFNFHVISNLTSESIETIQKKVDECVDVTNKNPYFQAISIAGANLKDEKERSNYIQNNILKIKSIAIEKLAFLSNLYKLNSNLSAVDSAIINILELADYDVVIGFLAQCGSIKFDRHSDEYTTYDGSKLAHLSTNCINTIIEILSKSKSSTPYSNRLIIEELKKAKGI
jgi:hypothetical protein